MLKAGAVSLDRAWNSWSKHPADLVFLPLGLKLSPVLYASSLGKASRGTAGRDILFLDHATDGSLIRFVTTHGGTRLTWNYRREPHDPWTVTGSWQAEAFGEWALRYWVSLAVSGEEGQIARRDPESGALLISAGSRVLALVSDQPPVQVTSHESVEALAGDFEARGYFTKAARGDEGACLAMRFTLEMSARCHFALSLADTPALAIARAKAALGRAAEPLPAPLHQGRHAGALDAIRDIMGWNSLWDAQNHRIYTPCSRIWYLGEFAVWYNDACYNALMAGLFDAELARDNLISALASATPQGNIACITTSEDAWLDRSQPPNGALVVWLMYQRRKERSLLTLAFEPLAANQRWWRAHRDPDGIGLISCGTSDVGDGLYKGSHFGARNETGMDNSPTHDEAVFDEATGHLSLIDLGLNCALALDAEMLAKIAAELGRHEEAAEFEALAADSRAQIQTRLWDASRGIFANRQREAWGGGFVKALGPTSFYPMLCDACSPAQRAALLAHLQDPATFGGDYVIPTVSRADPAYGDNVYWRGRIWPHVNWFVWLGLRRQKAFAEAGDFAAKSMRLFMQNWQKDRVAAENYNAETGEGRDQGDADPFYAWSAMLPLTGMGEIMDINPWTGWEISLTGEDLRFGPVEMPPGPVCLDVRGDEAELRQGDRLLLASSGYRGRLARIEIRPESIALEIWPDGAARGRLIWPESAGSWLTLIDGKPREGAEQSLDLAGLQPGTVIRRIRL